MLRQVLVPSKENSTISIPAEYYGMEVEIAVYPIFPAPKEKKLEAYKNLLKFRGTLKRDIDYKQERNKKEMLINLCNIVDIVDIDKQKILASLHNEDFSDIEDCLQMECAMRANVAHIITRNLSDFATSKIPAILPSDFLSIIKANIPS